MCGIAGIVSFEGLSPWERSLGRTMAHTLQHRGPDDIGAYQDAYASLGHTRLSIIDLDTGHQPIANEDHTLHVICNGEIYNHKTLAQDMCSRGHRFKTSSDTEVILHLYEEYGLDFVQHLNGMFAIALWDFTKKRLILVRDRLGIKPLFYHLDGSTVRFGSELKAILADVRVKRKIDQRALADYLTFGHVPAPRTIFQDIHKLEPGTMRVCTPLGGSLQRYWDIPSLSEDAGDEINNERDWQSQFESLLEDAVRLRLMADVPLGAFLSGGVDSATIVSAMTRSHPGRVLTHTVGFNEAAFDEREHAREAASLFRTDHREILVTPDLAATAQLLAHRFDEPFADSSAIPTYYLSKTTRERVTVALAGDGGDEMLAGYRRYRFDLAEHSLRRLAPSWLRRSTLGAAGWIYPKADWLPRPLRAKRTLQNIACDDVTGHLRSIAICAGELPDQWLRPDTRHHLNEYDPFERSRAIFARHAGNNLLNKLLYLDMKTLMVDDILTKVDRASMAAGLEVRVPLLDHRVVELAARMPASMKLRDTTGKHVLRQTLKRWGGEKLAQREKKGFDVPTDDWFRGPLRELAHDVIGSPHAWVNEHLTPELATPLLEAHQRGTRANGHLIWTLLSLELWAQAYIHNASPTEIDPPVRLETRPQEEPQPVGV